MTVVKVVVTTAELGNGEFTVRTTIYVNWWFVGLLVALLITLGALCR